MSQIGMKALKVLGGAESPNDTTAQLSEAWLIKLKKSIKLLNLWM